MATLSPQDYYLKPGETIEQYNARIESLRNPPAQTVQFDPNTGTKLATGQVAQFEGQTYTQGQPVPRFATNQAPVVPTTTASPAPDWMTALGVSQYGGAPTMKGFDIAAKLGVSPQQLASANPQLSEAILGNANIDLSWVRDFLGGLNLSFAASQPTSPATQTPDVAQQYGLTGESAQMVNLLQIYLDKLTQSGQNINPNVDITPERVAEFMTKAQSDIDVFLPYANKEIRPYYENLLKTERDSFLTTMGYSRDQLLATEQKLGEQYGKQQKVIGEQAAETGFALSGRRFRQEQELTDTAQRAISEGRQAAQLKATDLAGGFARAYGTENLPGFNIGATPKVGDAGFATQTGEQPFYQLSPDVYAGLKGEKQFEQEAATRKRAAELEEAFRSTATTQQQRNLTF